MGTKEVWQSSIDMSAEDASGDPACGGDDWESEAGLSPPQHETASIAGLSGKASLKFDIQTFDRILILRVDSISLCCECDTGIYELVCPPTDIDAHPCCTPHNSRNHTSILCRCVPVSVLLPVAIVEQARVIDGANDGQGSAQAEFAFLAPSPVNQLRIFSGVGRKDHHLLDFQLELKVGDNFQAPTNLRLVGGKATIAASRIKLDTPCSFTKIDDAAISGHDLMTNLGSVEACKERCCQLAWCKSIDNYKTGNKCDLSDKAGYDVQGGLKTDYPNNPYEHYVRDLQSPDTVEIAFDAVDNVTAVRLTVFATDTAYNNLVLVELKALYGQ